MLKKLLLYFHTVKYLRFIQIYYRIFYFIYKPNVSCTIKKNDIQKNSERPETFIKKSKIFINGEVATFINYSKSIANKNCWSDLTQEKLWLYNLHYFDALNAEDSAQQKIAYTLLEKWEDENLPFEGIGWEPFPLSLRIVNIIKYALEDHCLSEKIKNSLYLQARILNKKCEYHLLGNHLFENFKALCFAGLFFDTKESQQWFYKGLKGLNKEIKEQILKDGGHFELSPMYHCIILEGLLDLQNIFKIYQKNFLWHKEVHNMLFWLNAMKRSTTEISHFNDAANSISETPEMLFQYAKKLGYQFQSESSGVSYLPESGFITVKNNNFKIICDVGNIGPDYLPGHAHADTLSFELYVDQIPVFVNLGTSCYGNSDRRLFERSTAAHNTVVMNDCNSSDVWSSFRVGKRARIAKLDINETLEKMTISAAHNGYKRFSKNCIHERRWEISENLVEITDQINHPLGDIFAFFHLHPNCDIVSEADKKIMIQLENSLKIDFESENKFSIIDSFYANTFGDLQKTKSIKIKLESVGHISLKYQRFPLNNSDISDHATTFLLANSHHQ